jgi:ankyrin repeat protein
LPKDVGQGEQVDQTMRFEKGNAMDGQNDLEKRLNDAATVGDVVAVKQALEDGADALANDSRALFMAVEYGHVECARLLIPVSDPLAHASKALLSAAELGYAELVMLLIPVSDTLSNNSCALTLAAANGHAECVRMLIPVSDPKAAQSSALREAAERGHGECVGLLLPVSEKWAAAAAVARKGGFLEMAGMIEAFGEAMELAKEVKKDSAKTRQALAL